MPLKLEIASWKISKLNQDQDFYLRLEEATLVGKENKADIIFFPSYITFEFLSLYDDPEDIVSLLLPYADAFEMELKRLSRESGMILVGGSYLKEIKSEIFVQRFISYPNGENISGSKSDLSKYEEDILKARVGEGALTDKEGRFIVGTTKEISSSWGVILPRDESLGTHVQKMPECSSDQIFIKKE